MYNILLFHDFIIPLTKDYIEINCNTCYKCDECITSVGATFNEVISYLCHTSNKFYFYIHYMMMQASIVSSFLYL